ncbi:MAG: PBP1A family penicillin-binding protein [Candidatus Daviesbacteria bacterium]|nr:PBP1A family penicillin-binding protein [Candidatus Daviesbacteria bacterium]
MRLLLLLVKFILIKIGNVPIQIFHLRGAMAHLGGVLHPRHARGRPRKFHLSKRSKIAIALSAFTIFLVIYTVFILTAAYQLPTPTKLTSYQQPLTTEIYDRNGELLYRLYKDRNRSLVKLAEIPPFLIQATLAIEDQNFYRHIGIDPPAILRALYHNLRNESMEGASTITQQLIKNSLLTPEKTYARKLREIILSLWTERIYSKDQILQMYFNETPYGGSIMGIAAASQTYFGKPPSKLTLAEAAFLAGLPASPTQFSPYGTRPELAKLRQQEVLQKMVKEGYITKAQKDEAAIEEINIQPLANNIRAPHFVFYIRDLLSEMLGPRLVSQGGLKIYTTLDLKLQETAEEIVREEVEKLVNLNVKNGAAMITDAGTGQILAMVGSRDYHYPGFGNFNVALSLRQPGSSIKPITYATAFEKGYTPNSTILDIPVTFRDGVNSYSPVNYDGKFRGPVSLRQALAGSLNIPAVKLLATVGIESFIQTARDLGISTFSDPSRFGLSLTLGGGEIKMIEMMGVYGAFSQNGEFRQPTGIIKVTDSNNNILEEYKDTSKQAISPQIAYLINNILSDDQARSLSFGRGSLLNIQGFEVAVKTGTSDSKRDNWTFGYTPKYVVGVWVGNPDNTPMNPSLTSGITGAAPIWNRIMHTLLDGTKPLAFERPAGIKETSSKSMVKIIRDQDKIIFSDAFSTYATSSAQAKTPPSL